MEDTDDRDTLSDSFYLLQMVSEEDTTPGEAKCVSIEDSVQSSKWIVPLVANRSNSTF